MIKITIFEAEFILEKSSKFALKATYSYYVCVQISLEHVLVVTLLILLVCFEEDKKILQHTLLYTDMPVSTFLIRGRSYITFLRNDFRARTFL